MTSFPFGTVAFLFTDIEASTALLQRLGDRRYAEVLAEHQWLLRETVRRGRRAGDGHPRERGALQRLGDQRYANVLAEEQRKMRGHAARSTMAPIWTRDSADIHLAGWTTPRSSGLGGRAGGDARSRH